MVPVPGVSASQLEKEGQCGLLDPRTVLLRSSQLQINSKADSNYPYGGGLKAPPTEKPTGWRQFLVRL